MSRVGNSRAWRNSDKHCCYYCRLKLTPQVATRDHVVPRAHPDFDRFKGRRNIVISCKPCNIAKGTTAFREFLRSDWLYQRRREVHHVHDAL